MRFLPRQGRALAVGIVLAVACSLSVEAQAGKVDWSAYMEAPGARPPIVLRKEKASSPSKQAKVKPAKKAKRQAKRAGANKRGKSKSKRKRR